MSAGEAPIEETIPQPEHWGHWPLVTRRLGRQPFKGTSNVFSDEENEQPEVREIEINEELPRVKTKPPNWDRVLDNALEKIQSKLRNERIEKLRKRQLRRELEKRLEEEEEIMQIFLMLDDVTRITRTDYGYLAEDSNGGQIRIIKNGDIFEMEEV